MSPADFPFGYMYAVRLRTPLRALSLLLTDWVPLVLVLTCIYRANAWLIVLMVMGNFALYECGYYVNDLADSSREPNGDHLEGRHINSFVFYSSRLALFLCITALLFHDRGAAFALRSSVSSACVLFGFLWHTSRRPRAIRFVRIFTFTFLSLYKFAPIVIPWVDLHDALWIVSACFFSWHLWRVISYTLIKFGRHDIGSHGDYDPQRLLHLMSLLVCAPLLLSGGYGNAGLKASGLIWSYYAVIAVSRSGFQLTQWKQAPSNWKRKWGDC